MGDRRNKIHVSAANYQVTLFTFTRKPVINADTLGQMKRETLDFETLQKCLTVFCCLLHGMFFVHLKPWL